MFSFDRKQAFRLFITNSIEYFDKSRTLDLYVIPILRPEDAGDPKTTFLAKGIEAGLRYRSLFLEPTSPFSPVMFRFGAPSEFRQMVGKLLRELRLLLVRSDEARLNERNNLVWLFGPKEDNVNEVLTMIDIWNTQKEQLYAAAEAALGDAARRRGPFIQSLQEFCDKTKPLNTAWLTKVMKTLEDILAQERPAIGPNTISQVQAPMIGISGGASVGAS